MANQRLVNTNFWKDTYVIDLDPTQKLLFLYFLTNPRTTLAGVYEMSIREVAFDTGIDKDMVEKILQKFVMDDKMYYEKGWLVLRNFVKHQRLNPSIKQGIEKAVAELPEWLQKVVKDHSFFYNQQRLGLTDSPQTGISLPPDSPQMKLNEAKRKEGNLKEAKGSIAADAADLVAKKYYDVIKAYALPVRNHNHVHAAIKKLKAEISDTDAVIYLDFLLNQFEPLRYSHKPELSDALDIHAKRLQIINSVKRAGTRQTAGKGFRV